MRISVYHFRANKISLYPDRHFVEYEQRNKTTKKCSPLNLGIDVHICMYLTPSTCIYICVQCFLVVKCGSILYIN